MVVPDRQLFIDGRWTRPVRNGRMDVINPATEQVVGTVPAATAEDALFAVEAAARAFKGWKKTTGKQRAAYLRAIATKVGLFDGGA